MANHLRRQIREAIATAVTGLTTTGSRVYQSRVYPLRPDNLPALRVMTQSESVATATLPAPRLLERRLRVDVEAVAQAAADLDDTLDGICKEVEIALAMPLGALGALVKTITLQSVDITLVSEADQPVGVAAMAYEAVYMAAENAPDVAY
jgi:hypothetical protein